MESVESVAGLSKFYLYTEVSSEFEVISGGLGDAEEKATFTVNNNGDEIIDEIRDTVEFDPAPMTPGTTEQIMPNANESIDENA